MQRLLLILAVLSPFVHCVLDDDDDDVHVAHGKRLSKPEFDACVKKCGDQYENCSKAIHTLWLNFRKNRQKITAEMVKCCLAGETDHSQPPTLSFATCVRDNCQAEMWGFVSQLLCVNSSGENHLRSQIMFQGKQLIKNTLTVTLLLIFTPLWAPTKADRSSFPLTKPEFDACVRECGHQYEKCSRAIHYLWLNFRRNRQRIMEEMVKCCLAGELDHTQPPTLSFATCVRDNCHAEMWGCNIKKRHSGFLSEDEKLGILERENREKERKRKLRSSKPFRILP